MVREGRSRRLAAAAAVAAKARSPFPALLVLPGAQGWMASREANIACFPRPELLKGPVNFVQCGQRLCLDVRRVEMKCVQIVRSTQSIARQDWAAHPAPLLLRQLRRSLVAWCPMPLLHSTARSHAS